MPTPLASESTRENMPKIRVDSSGVDPDAVVAHGHDPLLAAPLSADTSTRGGASPRNFTALPTRFWSTRLQLARVAVDLGQVADLERRVGLVQARAQVVGYLGHQLAQPRPARCSARPRARSQHRLDQLLCPPDALAQHLQHVRARRSSAPRSSRRTSSAMLATGSRRSCATTSA